MAKKSNRSARRFSRKPVSAAVLASVAGLTGYVAHLQEVHAASASWISTTASNWSTGASWNTGSAPGATDGTFVSTDIATFNTSPGVVVTIDKTNQNIGGINFSNAINTSGYTIGSTTGNTLYLTAGGAFNDTATNSGTQTIAAPLVFEGNYSINDTAVSNNYIISGSVTDSSTLTITGSTATAADSSVTFSGSLANFTGNLNISTGAFDRVAFTSGTAPTNATINIGNSSSSASTLYTTLTYGSGVTFNVYGAGSSEGYGALRMDSGTINGSVVLQTANATIGDQATNGTINGPISGSGGLTKVGSGFLTLNGTDTYSSGTTINAGTLVFNSSASVPTSGQILVNASGSLSISGAFPTDYALLASGLLSTSSTGTLLEAGLASQLTETEYLPSSGLSAVYLNLNNSAAANYTGVIASSGTYRFTGGSGTLSLLSPVTGSASLVFNSGTINIAGPVSTTGTLAINNGTLNLLNYESIGGLTVAAGTSTTNAIATINSGAQVFIGSGGINLNQSVLSGANAYLNVGTSGNAVVTNAGPLNDYREGVFNIGSGAVFNQSGAVYIGPNTNTAYNTVANINGVFNYNGSTAITVAPSNSTSAGSSTLNIAGGALLYTDQGFNYGANGSTAVASITLTGGGQIVLTSAVTALTSGATSGTFQVGNLSGGVINTGGYSTAISKPIGNVSGQVGVLTVAGYGGTLTTSAANTYNGSTAITQGATLAVAAGGSFNSSSSLNLAGGTLSLASAASAQTFAGTTISTGASSIASSSSNLLTLGALTRSAGGTVDFGTIPSGGITTTTGNTNGILGGWATVGNGANWATGGGLIGSLSVSDPSYATASTLGSGGTYTNLNVDIDSSVSPSAAIAPNSLRFNTGAAETITLTGANNISSGGILVTPGVGTNASTITGGTLTGPAAGGDLIVNQYDANATGALTISSVIANGTAATSLTKSGPGTLYLTGANTYTGTTYVDGGTLNVSSKASADTSYVIAAGAKLYIGYSSVVTSPGYAGSITVNGSGTSNTELYFKGGTSYDINNAFVLQGAPTTISTFGTGNVSLFVFDTNSIQVSVAAAASGSVTTSTVAFNVSGYGLNMTVAPGVNTSTGDFTVAGPITSTPYTGEGLNKKGAGSLLLTGASTFNYLTTIQAGSIILAGGNNRLPAGTYVTLGSGGTSGALLLNGISQQLTGIYTSGTGTADNVLGNSTTPSTLVVNYTPTTTYDNYGGNLGSISLGANASNLTLNKIGAGTLELSGNNYYTGGTNVTAGSISFLTASSLPYYNTSAAVAFSAVNASSNGVVEIGITAPGSLQAADVPTLLAHSNAQFFGIDTALGSTAYAGNLSGSFTFVKNTPNTLSLTGTNTYTGSTNISGGTLEAETTASLAGYTSNPGVVNVLSGGTLALAVGGANQFAYGDLALLGGYANYSSGSTLAVDTSNPANITSGFTYGNSLYGAYGFTKLGPNTLYLTAGNSYQGPTTIAGGTLSLGTTGYINAPTLVFAGGTLATAQTNAQSFTTTVLQSGANAINNSGSATVSLGTVNRSAGATIDFGSGSVGVSNSNTNGILGGYATVNGGAAFAAVSGGVIVPLSTSDASYNKTSVLGAAGPYTNLNIDVDASASPTAVISVNSLRFNNAAAATLTLPTGQNTIVSGGILVTPSVGANVSTITGGTLNSSSGDLIIHQYDTAGNLVIASTMNGSSGLTKTGPGTLVLAPASNSTYTGVTQIYGGTVIINGSGSSGGVLGGTPSITVAAGATLQLNGSSADLLGYTAGKEAITLNGGTLTNSGQRQTVENPITMVGGTITESNSAILEMNSAVAFNATSDSVGNPATVNGAIPLAFGTQTFNVSRGVIAPPVDMVVTVPITAYSGTQALVKSGSGVLEFTAADTYTGGTSITGGTLLLGNASAISATGQLNVSGGVLDLNGFSPSQGVVNLIAGSIINSNASAASLSTTLLGLESGTLSANITTAPQVIKTTPGLAYLTGTNTFTGPTLINGGVLESVTTSSLPGVYVAGNVTVQPGGTLALAVGSAPQYAASDVTTALSKVNFLAGSYIGFDTTYSGGSFSYAPVISGVQGVAKLGAGTLVLTGSNTYTGGTVIDQGTLSVPGDYALGTVPSSPATNITFSGGTLQLTSPTTISTNRSIVTNSAAAALPFSGGATIDTFGNAVGYAGVISGGGSLSVTSTNGSSGVLTLSGTANTYAGGTFLNGGTLAIAGDGSLGAVPAAPAVNITFNGGTLQFTNSTTLATNRSMLVNAAGGTIDLNSQSVSYGGVISGTGNLVVNNTGNGSSGVLTLTNSANTDSGTLTINAGTVNLAAAISPTSTELFSSIIVNAGANLETTGTHTFGYYGPGYFRPTLVVNGGTITNIAGNDNYLGQITMTGGTINGTGQYRLQATSLSSMIATLTTNSAPTTATISIPSLSLYSPLTINTAAGTGTGPDLLISSSLTNSGAITFNGPGSLELTGSANAYTGSVLVQSGTLIVANTSGSATGSGTITLNGGVLASGTTGNASGAVMAGSGSHTIAPGGIGTIGSLAIGGLTSNYLTTINFDLGAGPGPIVTNGDLLTLGTVGTSIANGTMITFNTSSTVAGDDYRLIGDTSGGSTVAGITLGNFTLPSPVGTQTYALSTSVDPGYIDLVVGGVSSGPNTLIWNNSGATGDGLTWTTGSASSSYENFQNVNTSSPAFFSAGDNVSFTDNNNGNYTVNIIGTVAPGSTTFNASGTYTVTAGTTGSGIGGTGGLTVAGTGSVILSSTNTYTGDTQVSAGRLVVVGSTALPSTTNLNISAGAQVTVQNHGSGAIAVVQVSGLNNAGLINLTDNDLIIKNGGSAALASVFTQIQAGFNGGAWNGSTGIKSTTAANDPSHLTALGYMLNGGTYGGGGIASFDGGVVPGASDVLIKYTYYGDANLDGAVDGSDYTLIDNGFNNHLTGWQNGDFNYDGVIDGSDYTLIDNAFNIQGGSLGVNPAALVASATSQIAGGGSAVPEPATIGLLGMGAASLLTRRRRRNG